MAYILLTFTLVIFSSFSPIDDAKEEIVATPMITLDQYACQLYECVNENNINLAAFNLALNGYFNLMANHQLENPRYLTIIDMSLSANEERFFIIDMETQQLVSRSLVAHGRNTGEELATRFSNKEGSYQTSLGFYKTAETYDGKRGFSLKLDGLEYSNNNARDRGIIIHGAEYVSEKFIKENVRLGRSLGCPSLPMKSHKEAIKLIKEGTCLFIYYPQKYYLSRSKLTKRNDNYLLTNSGMIASVE